MTNMTSSSGSTGTSSVAPVQADYQQVYNWIQLVHGDTADGLIHICSQARPNATSNWIGRTFSEARDAADYVMRLDAQGDLGIYLRTTTLARVPIDESGRRGRGGIEDSKILPGFAVDLDLAGPGHKHTVCPPDCLTAHVHVAFDLPGSVEDAMEIVGEVAGLPNPTAWVHSGGGVYPWWLFDEPVDISDPAVRKIAQDVSDGIQKLIKHAAESRHWHFGTGINDMARVLRIPGTINRKEGLARPCRVIEPASYDFTSLETLGTQVAELVAALPPASSPAPVRETARTTPSPGASTSDRPGDDYENRNSWVDILAPDGWDLLFRRGQTLYWRRPGKTEPGHSATTGNAADRDRLYVFSSETGLPVNEPITKFAYYALTRHNGNHAAAASDLRGQGYGGQTLPSMPTNLAALVPPKDVEVVEAVSDESTEPEPEIIAAELEIISKSKPHIAITSEQETIVSLCDSLNSGSIPNLYVQDGMPVYVAHKTNLAGGSAVNVLPLTADRLNLLLAKHVATHKVGKNGLPQLASTTAAMRNAVVQNDDWPGLPILTGIISTPTLRPDGSLIQDTGWDSATGLYYEPSLKIDRVPDVITDEQVRTSREFVFSKVFGEFCWASPGDFANYLALLVSPMLRPYVKTTTPFGMVTASTPGSGKTNLTDAAGLLYGQTSQVLPGRTEELQKKITSILAGNSSPVVVFDNLKEGTTISSEILATLVTKEAWDDRMLGASRNIEARNDRLWLASGNGLTVGGDMASRTVMVRLDPRMARPELRQFELGQFSDWIREDDNRAQLMWHLLVLVQAWVQGGKTTDTSHTMRNFTRWAQIMGGLLAFHGVTGFLSNADDLESRDSDAEEWHTFLAKWSEIFGSSAKTTRELHASAQVEWVMGTSMDRWSRAFITDENGLTPTVKQLGNILASHRDRFHGKYILRSRRNHDNATVWSVEKREDDE